MSLDNLDEMDFGESPHMLLQLIRFSLVGPLYPIGLPWIL
jgi:hypothetical protein